MLNRQISEAGCGLGMDGWYLGGNSLAKVLRRTRWACHVLAEPNLLIGPLRLILPNPS